MGQVSNWKKIGKHIFIRYFITFLGEHSNVNNVINALLCLCSCFYVHVFVVNYFRDFPEFFFCIEGWVGEWGVSYQNFFAFLYFFYIYKAPSKMNTSYFSPVSYS